VSGATVILGASSAIGVALARRLIERNEPLFLTYYEHWKALEWASPRARLVHVDVGNSRSVRDGVAGITAYAPSIGRVVYCAARTSRTTVRETTPGQWREIFDATVHGAFYATKEALPYMEPGGKIIYLSSTSAGRACPDWIAYAAAKAALDSFAMSTAASVFDDGIRVYLLQLGRARSPLRTILAPNEDGAAGVAAGTILSPETIAKTIEQFLYAKADVMAGSAIRVHAENRLQ